MDAVGVAFCVVGCSEVLVLTSGAVQSLSRRKKPYEIRN